MNSGLCALISKEKQEIDSGFGFYVGAVSKDNLGPGRFCFTGRVLSGNNRVINIKAEHKYDMDETQQQNGRYYISPAESTIVSTNIVYAQMSSLNLLWFPETWTIKSDYLSGRRL